MSDPRADNCKAFHLDASGRVDGVLLQYDERPSALYELYSVRLVSEADAGGNTVATCTVVDRNSMPVAENVYLAWPYPALSQRLLPGNPNGQHMIMNGFNAAAGEIGPLSLYVGDSQGNVISDVVYGLGLPNNRHVSYRVTWRERGAPEPEPGDPGDGEQSSDVLAAINRTNELLAALCKHLGVKI